MNLLKLSDSSQTRLCIVLTASIVFACYLPTLSNGFVWDDSANFIKNSNYRGLSPSHLFWMFTTFHDANYHPLAWLTLGLDFVLWGMNPVGYHLTNLALHVCNAVLFYFMFIVILRGAFAAVVDHNGLGLRMGAVLGALFFAVHPLRVETVSWISTRGDLLCGFFYMLAIISYFNMNEVKAVVNRKKWLWLSLLFFVLSLLSRAWGITLPVVFLIIDIYPLRRVGWTGRSASSPAEVLLEKIPFFLFACGASIMAVMAKKASMVDLARHDIVDRIIQAAYGLSFYPLKTLIPIRLSPFYLLGKGFDPMAAKYIISALALMIVTAGLIIMRRRWPWAITAWLCYAVSVSPLLGLVQSGPQITADRYTYIAGIPFAILVGAGVLNLWRAWKNKAIPSYGWHASMAGIVIWLIFMWSQCSAQITIWRDDNTLLDHILKLDPGNYTSYYDRGILRGKQGDVAGAFADYSRSIRLNPENAKAYNNRGVLLKAQGDFSGAMADYNNAIRLKPFSPEAYANRGVLHLLLNDQQRAVKDLEKALEVASNNWAYKRKVEEILDDILDKE